MNTEQERADFEMWCHTRSLDIGRDDKGDYISLETYLSWEGYQAGRAALQSQEYTAAIGGAGQAYLDRFKNAHALPAEFRWSELWAVMCVAANKGRTDALQSQDREDALRYRFLKARQDIDDEDLEFAVLVNAHFDLFQSSQELEEAIDHARRAEGGGE